MGTGCLALSEAQTRRTRTHRLKKLLRWFDRGRGSLLRRPLSTDCIVPSTVYHTFPFSWAICSFALSSHPRNPRRWLSVIIKIWNPACQHFCVPDEGGYLLFQLFAYVHCVHFPFNFPFMSVCVASPLIGSYHNYRRNASAFTMCLFELIEKTLMHYINKVLII